LGNVEGHRSRVEGHKSRVKGRKSRSRFKSRGRGSKVEGRKSKILNFYHFKSFTTIKRGKTISFAVKTEKFRLWLCRMAMYCITESFACGTKSLMPGFMFEGIHLLFYIGV
jgi:hypothetical protein